MAWAVLEHPDFSREVAGLPRSVRIKLNALIVSLAAFGPSLGRPQVDTLKGSAHANMKELRVRVAGEWRFAFAFDMERRAIILVGGNKEGLNQKRFYKELVATADARFDDWLSSR